MQNIGESSKKTAMSSGEFPLNPDKSTEYASTAMRISRVDIITIAQGTCGAALTELISKCATKTMTKLLVSTACGAIAPVVGMILNAIWPAGEDPITWADIESAIDRRIHKRLGQEHLLGIRTKYESTINTYSLMMAVIEKNNASEPDKSKWNLGTIEQWMTLLQASDELEGLCIGSNYKKYAYHVHQMVPDVLALRLLILFGALQTLDSTTRLIGIDPPSDELEAMLENMRTQTPLEVMKGSIENTFKRWHDFLQSLVIHACGPEMRNDDDFKVEKLLGGVSHVYDNVTKSSPKKIYVAMFIHSGYVGAYNGLIHGRYMSFIVMNTTILSMCQAYDKTVKEYLDKIKKFPEMKPKDPLKTNSKVDIFDKFAHEEYVKWMTSQQKGGEKAAIAVPPDPKVKNKFAAAPGLKPYVDPVSKTNYYPGDLYVVVETARGSKYFGVGDYVDLELEGIDATNAIGRIWVPRGFQAFFYDKPAFAGTGRAIPSGNSYTQQNAEKPNQDFLIDFSQTVFGSLKVRVNTALWFDARYFARIITDSMSLNSVPEIRLVDMP